ncbi:unnamed protein product [Camellia sinensis]
MKNVVCYSLGLRLNKSNGWCYFPTDEVPLGTGNFASGQYYNCILKSYLDLQDKFVSGTKVELGFLFHRYTLFRSLTSVTQSSILRRFPHPLWL